MSEQVATPQESTATDIVEARTVRVTSWANLQEILLEDAWNPGIMRHRSRRLFRGHSRADFELMSGLARTGGRQTRLEKHLLRNFNKYARSYLDPAEDQPRNFWHWMSLAQHHGLPTRLLDWTYSPLIAAHFSCHVLADMATDGAIWIIDYHMAHELLSANLKGRLKSQGANVFTDEMLSQEIGSLEELDSRQTPDDGQVLFFEPPSISARIINQYACFSVQIGECRPMMAWLSRHPEMWKKVVIPADLKWEIRDKLDQSNITERVLFPGLDGLCDWLARQYYPRVL
ncbi:FRG domain-containing protein [Roseovarius sp. MBR-6]|uniref:FRG domain-containing protein n=1 Tax=Roseovarius sp. MBR-6 TaxID=3156459 RepID=UPI0033911851